jgi:hypothetical protein
MENFKFLDDRSDIEGMEYMEQTMGFNGTHFKVQYYTDLSSDDRFSVQMHIYATLGSVNMEFQRNIDKFKEIMDEFYHRVNIEMVELSDIDDTLDDLNIE